MASAERAYKYACPINQEFDMNTMMESLEGRQMFSISLTPAAPSPLPVPYPNTSITAADSGKVSTTEIVVIKTTDTTSPKLF
jgi:hypothetical protein